MDNSRLSANESSDESRRWLSAEAEVELDGKRGINGERGSAEESDAIRRERCGQQVGQQKPTSTVGQGRGAAQGVEQHRDDCLYLLGLDLLLVQLALLLVQIVLIAAIRQKERL